MKINNNFSNGKMNKDLDERLVPKGGYTDALNIRVLNTEGSDAGAIENTLGNKQLTFNQTSNSPITIGSVNDEANEKIYWFVVNSLGHSFIYEYDAKNTVTATVLRDTRDAANQVLNFNKDYKITGANIVLNTYDSKKLLIFTDGLNPPRSVNITRAKTFGENNFIEDDISLYKKPPRFAPLVTPFNTPTAFENSVKENFFAFAYRYKYLDGEYSAISSFSNYQFTPGDFDFDYATMENKAMVNIFNSYQIKFNTGDKRVTDIQIVFKMSQNPTCFIAETLNKQESGFIDDIEKSVIFSNKKIYKALPDDEISRIFDDVPLTAKAQEFIENRVVFGNITTQYDLKENESDAGFIATNYFAEKKSTTFEGSLGTVTFSSDKTEMTLDLSNVELEKDYYLYVGADLESDEDTSTDPSHFNGTAELDNAVKLSETYVNAAAFDDSADLQQLLSALSNNFASLVNTTPPPDSVTTQYGGFTLASSTSTSITIKAPKITYTIDNTPSDSSTADGDTSTKEEQFKFKSDSVFTIRESSNTISLKSNRSYEFGLVYLDEHGRYSTVLPSVVKEGNQSPEIFIPVENSIDLNQAELTVKHKPPYWADRYKFFIKMTKKLHFTLYSTIFYEDGLYRWVLLTGNNIGKVEEGTNLLVKSDDNGHLNREVKVKVLEVATKTKMDEEVKRFDSDDPDEGWIEGNRDAADNPIKEIPGVFMKIKPVGFKMDFDPNNFAEYNGSDHVPWGLSNSCRGHVNRTLPVDSEFGLAQVKGDSSGNTVYNHLTIGIGSRIKIAFEGWEGADADGDDGRYYNEEFVSGDAYVGDDTMSGFEKFLIAETAWEKPDGQTYYADPDNQFHLQFGTSGTANSNNNGIRHTVNVKSTEFTRKLERGWGEFKISLILVNGIIVFETDPDDNESEIFYETEECFEIAGGFHLGNKQNQTSSQDAKVLLSTGNCFVFGNGVESIQIRDERNSPFLDLDLRPNIALLEGYKRRNLETTLIHSSTINQMSSYNALNEFNASRGIRKNLDQGYGSIQKIFSREQDLIIFQEDRVSKVLFGKSLLHSADGSASLTKIESVLGQEVPFSGEYGISENPESFAFYAGRMYFTDANRGTVLRLGNDGITPISYYGMKSYFKSTLWQYKDAYNVGGFDPKHHQYVLSMNTDDKPAEALVYDCGSIVTKTIESGTTYNFVYKLGTTPGTATVSWNNFQSNSAMVWTVKVVYAGTTYPSSSGFVANAGSISFPVTTSNLSTNPTATVTITSGATSTGDITLGCPVAAQRKVTQIVINDRDEANQTIQNKYQVGTNAHWSEDDVFLASGLTRNQSFTGDVGSTYVPADGDQITVRSVKQLNYHTGDFNICNSLGYLISPSSGLTVDQIKALAEYPDIDTSESDSDNEVNKISFPFNESSPADNLYIVYNYIDALPNIVPDTITGITNGGSVVIDVLQNDTVPSPFTLTIQTPPTSGTATVNSDNTITYQHTAGTTLNDSFIYQVTRDGACQAVGTVSTQALALTVDTYIYFYFDSSGSMDDTGLALNEMANNSLKAEIQTIYAPGSSDNGSTEYDSHVTVSNTNHLGSQTTDKERTFQALRGPEALGAGNFPSDADNVIVLVFQDEASAGYHGSNFSDSQARTSTYTADVIGTGNPPTGGFKDFISTKNAGNSNYYRGGVFQVEGNTAYKPFLQAVFNGTGNYSGTNGLSSEFSQNVLRVEFDIEDTVVSGSTIDNNQAPFKPGSTTDRFDKWEYYYLYWVTKMLNDMGYTPAGSTWPVIKDDG